MTNNRPILNGDRLDASLTAGARAALRLLLVVLLALLAINAIAILLLNAMYDPDALRHRHLWRPVLLRNLILSIPYLLLLYFSRSSADVPLAESVHGRVRPLFTRLLRILLWMALLLVAAVEAVVLAGNLVFHQTLTVTRTPSQTLNLLYSVLIGLAASVYLTRTRASRPPGSDVPIELRTTVRNLLWNSLKRSAQFSMDVGCGVYRGRICVLQNDRGGQRILARSAGGGPDRPCRWICLGRRAVRSDGERPPGNAGAN